MTDPSRGDSDQIFRLIYRSHDRIPEPQRKVELGGLFSTARSKNKAAGITGALLVCDDWFVQVLEGDEQQVRDLFTHIEADPRHDQVAVLDAAPVVDRVFGRWAMAQVDGYGTPDIPLIAHRDGIAPAAGRRPTPHQEMILDLMREAAREAPQVV